MKKIVFLFAIVVSFVLTSCSLAGGDKIGDASMSEDNLQCSFVLDTPVGYDSAYGIGFSGVVYLKNGTALAERLWIPKAIYNKIISDQKIQGLKIYKGQCLNCEAVSKGKMTISVYFVYYVE